MNVLKKRDYKPHKRKDIVDSEFFRFKEDGPNFTSLVTFPVFFEWAKFLKYRKPELWKLLHEWKRRHYIRLIPGHGLEILK